MHKEIDFENAIEQDLLTLGGYTKGLTAADYDLERALFPQDILGFVQATQENFWKRMVALNKDKAGEVLLDSLVKELDSKGMLAVLREGFKCFGKTVRLAYFAPNTRMDPKAATRYAANRLSLIRQVKTKSGAILDGVIAVNGLPVATLELKNPLSATKWNVWNAIHQYRFERDPNEKLFVFKRRCLVHFAVDTELVYMTTQLEGKDTYFLPFNLGHQQGAGNPPVEGDGRTRYLWRDVLARDSLLDILARFVHLELKEKTIATDKGPKRIRTERMIFPRYHQLDACLLYTSDAADE